jgi:hypothetical protein
MLENTQSECPQKITCQHLHAESHHMLNASCSQPACMQTAAQGLAAARGARVRPGGMETACRLYRSAGRMRHRDRSPGRLLLTGRAPAVRLWGAKQICRSRARGDLNALSDIYVPFEAPVIRPDVSGNLASDIPNRLVSWGTFALPLSFTVSPVVDVHSGLPYSNVDALQNYVGRANSQQFPTFFSLDLKVYREFRLGFRGLRNRKLRTGVYALNLTNHSNWLQVFNNVTSPYFGHLAGMQHRVNGLVIDIVK